MAGNARRDGAGFGAGHSARHTQTAAYYEYELRAAQAAASSLGVELVFGPIGGSHAEIERAFEAFARTSNGGLLLSPERPQSPTAT